MGPRPSGRGNDKSVREAVEPLMLQWGRDRPVAETLPVLLKLSAGTSRFNGAATVRSRKHDARQDGGRYPRGLQWGRDRPVAETSLSAYAPRPLPACFNGAATVRSRKPVHLGAWPRGRPAASMGPRPSGRGNPHREGHSASTPLASMGPRPSGRGNIGSTSASERSVRLQWGRDRPVAETLE